jgi:hypothetical protein
VDAPIVLHFHKSSGYAPETPRNLTHLQAFAPETVLCSACSVAMRGNSGVNGHVRRHFAVLPDCMIILTYQVQGNP